MLENQQEICPMCQAKIVGGAQGLLFLDYLILDASYRSLSAHIYVHKWGKRFYKSRYRCSWEDENRRLL